MNYNHQSKTSEGLKFFAIIIIAALVCIAIITICSGCSSTGSPVSPASTGTLSAPVTYVGNNLWQASFPPSECRGSMTFYSDFADTYVDEPFYLVNGSDTITADNRLERGVNSIMSHCPVDSLVFVGRSDGISLAGYSLVLIR